MNRGKIKKIKGFTVFMDQLLGQGNFGKVYKGQCAKNQECAIKVIQKSIINNIYLKQLLWAEIQILTKVKSQNIVRCIDVQESANNYYIIQQLCQSDLEKYINQNPKIIEEEAIDFLTQIVNGFTVLVKEGIIHRDLKPSNILLKDDVVKIADFGTAKQNTYQKMRNQTYIGTPLYMAPQVLKGESYSSKCDVWAVGFIFYRLIHNKEPWYGVTRGKLVEDIQNNPLKIKNGLNPKTVDFLKKTLQIDEQKRLSWDEVFSHNIFHGFFDHLKENNKIIQNKLRMFMNCLKHEIDRKDIDVIMLIKDLHLKQELNLQEFRRFIRTISSDVSGSEIRNIFDQLADHKSGTISVSTIDKKMHEFNIQTQRSGLRKQIKEEEKTLKEKLFQELYKELKENNKELKAIFNYYSKSNPSIDFDKFRKMMSRYAFDDKDLLQIFQEIDTDNSKTIEYQQIKLVFCQVNFIPMQAFENQ